MPRIVWDATGFRTFEIGIDRGVLYSAPNPGIAWNGLVSVIETPVGGVAAEHFIDGLKRFNAPQNEEYTATITALSSPKEFAACAGMLRLSAGLFVTNQPRTSFGFSYRTLLGDEIQGLNAGYKIHVVYNATVKTGNLTYRTMSERPEVISYSWDITTIPETVPGYRPSAHFVIESAKMDANKLVQLEDILYGTATTDPRLPTAEELVVLTTAGYQAGPPDIYADIRIKKLRPAGVGTGISRVTSAPVKLKKLRVSVSSPLAAAASGKIDLLPYLVCTGTQGASVNTDLIMNVGDGGGWPVMGGEEIIAAGGSGGALPISITDQQGNTYTQRGGTATTPASSIWTATANANGLKAPMTGFTTGTIDVKYSGTGQAKQWIVIGCRNLGTRDKMVTPTTGNSTAPSISSGVMAEAGELIIAVVVHQNAGGLLNTPAGWHLVAKNITQGVNSYASMFVKIASSTASVTFTGTLPVAAGWTCQMLTYKASVVPLKDRVGASIFKAAYPGTDVSDNWDAHVRFDAVTSRNNAAIKRYCNEHDSTGWAGPGNDEEQIVSVWKVHGIKQVICVKPKRDVSGGTAAALAGLKTTLTYWRNNNVDADILMGNEPTAFGGNGPFGAGTSKDWNMDSPYAATDTTGAAANFKAWYNYYGKTIIDAGYQCGYNSMVNTITASLAFTPDRLQADGWPLCTHNSIDYYYASDYAPHGDTMAPIIAQADAMTPPCRVGISEMGASNSSLIDPIHDGDVAGYVNWLDNQITAVMAARVTPASGKKNAVICCYANGVKNVFDYNTDSRIIAAWQRLYDALNDPSA